MMRYRTQTLLLVISLVVVTAGCAGLLGQDDGADRPSPSERHTPTDTPLPTDDGSTPTATSTATRTVSPTPSPTEVPVDPDNPFGQRTVPVALRDTVEDRDMRPIAERALEYWSENSPRHTGFPVELTLVDESDDHRIAIEFDDSPVPCGHISSERTTGCSLLNRDDAPPVTTVTVARGYPDHVTYETMLHELGHSLGVSHHGQPLEFMDARQPTGVSRDPVRVLITGPDDASAKRSEVEDALEYFETHPSLSDDERLRWTPVHSVEEADLVVEFRDDGCFADSGGSCTEEAPLSGQQKVVMDSVDTDVVAWHTAYLLAPAFFDAGSMPEDLSSDTTREERERWGD